MSASPALATECSRREKVVFREIGSPIPVTLRGWFRVVDDGEMAQLREPRVSISRAQLDVGSICFRWKRVRVERIVTELK